MPEKITATYKIVTPMFIGDAEQKATTISPASIKGALRFWWRALNWGQIRQTHDSDVDALQQLHREEGALFGSAVDGASQQAKFLLQIREEFKAAETFLFRDSGIRYLLGQGLFDYKKGCLRDAIPPSTFAVDCRLHPKLSIIQKKQLSDALLALGTMGGLGSRARKGFGSLSIQRLIVGEQVQEIPADITELKSLYLKWQQSVEQPPFTAFSKLSRIDVSLKGMLPMDLLNKAGLELQLYRSYGRKQREGSDHKVGSQKAEQNFKDDHDLLWNSAANTPPSSIPRRTVFGLPHNYFFSSNNKKVDFTLKEKNRGRRASPLFMHIHEFVNGQVLLIQILMPADFVSQGDKLEFNYGRSAGNIYFNQNWIEWGVVHEYMNRFNSGEVLYGA